MAAHPFAMSTVADADRHLQSAEDWIERINVRMSADHIEAILEAVANHVRVARSELERFRRLNEEIERIEGAS